MFRVVKQTVQKKGLLQCDEIFGQIVGYVAQISSRAIDDGSRGRTRARRRTLVLGIGRGQGKSPKKCKYKLESTHGDSS